MKLLDFRLLSDNYCSKAEWSRRTSKREKSVRELINFLELLRVAAMKPKKGILCLEIKLVCL
jgi:hypothetical protein